MQGSILPVPQNYSEGLKWLRKVARADGTGAQIELAKAYRDGTGVNVDLMKSYIWFSIAARVPRWRTNVGGLTILRSLRNV
jgi:TPR repeat protein